MSLIGFCIAIMLGLSIFSVVSGNSFISGSESSGYEGITWINGSSTSITVDDTTVAFGISEIEGALIIIVVIAVAVSLLSIKVLGSGIGQTGVQTLRTSIMYGGLWALLSILVIQLIQAILVFGALLYISLTFAYVYGVIKQIGDAG